MNLTDFFIFFAPRFVRSPINVQTDRLVGGRVPHPNMRNNPTFSPQTSRLVGERQGIRAVLHAQRNAYTPYQASPH